MDGSRWQGRTSRCFCVRVVAAQLAANIHSDLSAWPLQQSIDRGSLKSLRRAVGRHAHGLAQEHLKIQQEYV